MDKSKILIIKWNTKMYIISVKNNATVGELKTEISRVTGVALTQDPLKNLKIRGKKLRSYTKLSAINVLAGTTITLADEKVNLPSTSQQCTSRRTKLSNKPAPQLEKLQSAIETSKRFCTTVDAHASQCTLKVLTTPRPDKKLLVLDLDQTLVDIKKFGIITERTRRPFLNTFLTQVYPYYDLVIWSATDMEILEDKLDMISLTRTTNFKIMALADRDAMLTIFLPEYGILPLKPLGVIWKKYKSYNKSNTIMVDDLYSNMALNPLNGITVSPYEEKNYLLDSELLRLTKYLIYLAKCSRDFTSVNHKLWETYNPYRPPRSNRL